jgi:phospholipase D3/4
VDGKHVYVGSANMDWLSLTQVKELGILTKDSHAVAADTQAYFDQWWKWANPSIEPKFSTYFNPEFQATLSVPCFSTKLTTTTCKNPISDVSSVVPSNSQAQATALLNGTSGQFFLSASPYEIAASPTSSKKSSIRTWDLDGLLFTIQDAKEFVYLSVMDFMPTAGYSGGYGDQPLWWSDLVDALLVAATTKGIRVRMLTSYWAHTNAHEVPYLKPVQENAQVCRTGPYPPLCTGSLEIRLFEVPGWDSTGSGKDWPAYSRVNHAKYIVTDRRVNVGTSNMEWSYFYQTAGASLNTDHPLLRQGVQSVFERDWDSQYVYYLNGTAVNA